MLYLLTSAYTAIDTFFLTNLLQKHRFVIDFVLASSVSPRTHGASVLFISVRAVGTVVKEITRSAFFSFITEILRF